MKINLKIEKVNNSFKIRAIPEGMEPYYLEEEYETHKDAVRGLREKYDNPTWRLRHGKGGLWIDGQEE